MYILAVEKLGKSSCIRQALDQTIGKMLPEYVSTISKQRTYKVKLTNAIYNSLLLKVIFI